MDKERGIVIHCADTYPEMDIGREEINDWHIARGWDGIGYHYVIRRDGTVESGRDVDVMGAHAKGYNHYIGICLVGGKAHTNEMTCNFTSKQWRSLSELTVKTMLALDIPKDRILGHNEISKKSCPTFSVRDWID